MSESLDTLAIYQAENGAIELKSDTDTIWATQKQISQLFDITPQSVTIHLRNLYKREELDQLSTCKKSLQVQLEGKRRVQRTVKEYNLDVILIIGYRASHSQRVSDFRKWANNILKQHITQGYTLNPKILAERKTSFITAMKDLQTLTQSNEKVSTNDVLELIKSFSHAWFSLESYDKNTFNTKPTTTEITLDTHKLVNDLAVFKQELIAKNEATKLFATQKKHGTFEGIIGNVMQHVFGEELYPSIEEKATHLLYFVVKNHPFNDGNKRSGAFTFIWFLTHANYDFSHINSSTLASLTLLVAESDPNDKDKIIGLVLLLLQGNTT